MHESEKWKWSRSVMSNSSRPRGLHPTRLLRPWDFPGKSTGVGCHCLLQYISLTYQNLPSITVTSHNSLIILQLCTPNFLASILCDIIVIYFVFTYVRDPTIYCCFLYFKQIFFNRKKIFVCLLWFFLILFSVPCFCIYPDFLSSIVTSCLKSFC